jgi:AraC-like DNA-binding protein
MAAARPTDGRRPEVRSTMAAPAPEPATIRFSTRDLPLPERIPFVREAIGRKAIGLDMEPLPDQPFRMEAVQHVLPGLNVAEVVNSAMRVRRTRGLVADGDDGLVLAIPLAGAETFVQRGRDVTVADGEAVLLSNADIFEGVSPAGKRFLGLWLVRPSLAGLVPTVEDRFAQTIPRDNAALRLLAGHVNMLRDNAAALATPQLRRLTVNHIYDLVALALGASPDAAAIAKGRGLAAARLGAIKSDIAAHLGDNSLSVVAVAARQGVTPRYVQMLFEGEGRTFSQYVLATRLAHAHRMLTDARSAGLTITGIAFSAGFSDLSHFNRAFRRAYGATPSDVRATAWRDR